MIESFFSLSLPLLLAALGGLYSEKTGILNISLEGLMLVSSFFSLWIASETSSVALGIAAGIAISLFLTGLFILSTLYMKSDPFVSGLGINLLAYPLVSTFSRIIYGTEGTVRPEREILPSDWLFPLIAAAVLLFTMLFFSRSNPGRLIRLCGVCPDRLEEKGRSVRPTQSLSLMLGGAFAGISGAALSLPLGVFVPGMSAGKGWIALVAVYLGGGKAAGILPAVFLFSLFDLWAVNLQHSDFIPSDLVLSFPYFLTLLLALIYYFGKKWLKQR